MARLRRLVWNGVLCWVVWALVAHGPAFSGGWSRLAEVLDAWPGEKTAVLRADSDDPLALPEVRQVLELLTSKGFVVLPGASGEPPSRGVVVTLRRTGRGWTLAVSRASDGAFLVVEQLGAQRPSRQRRGPEGHPPGLPRAAATVELAGRPRGIAFPSGDHGAVLYDDRVDLLDTRNPSGGPGRARFRVPFRPSRALWIDAADLDGDGVGEIAATWAEDVQDIYEGTQSRIHSWILDGQTLEPLSADLGGYVRIVAGSAYLQRRGGFTAFAGPIRRIRSEGGRFVVGGPVSEWPPEHPLFEATPLPGGRWLSHRRGEPWAVLASGGDPVPGAVLSVDLGPFKGPAVAVRLETPEYRSGFEKEDRVTERWVPLPRRVVAREGGAVYTVRRGRSLGGLLLTGAPAGRDALVRLSAGPEGLGVAEVIWEEEAFVRDFALLPGASKSVALLTTTGAKDRAPFLLRILGP